MRITGSVSLLPSSTKPVTLNKPASPVPPGRSYPQPAPALSPNSRKMADHSPPKEGARASPYTEHMEARMRIVSKVLAERDDIRTLLPGLDSLLDDHLSPHVQVTQWEHFRRLLQVFRNSPDQTFEKCLDQLLPQQQKRIQKFVNGGIRRGCVQGLPNGTEYRS
jgi:hypothetical protein